MGFDVILESISKGKVCEKMFGYENGLLSLRSSFVNKLNGVDVSTLPLRAEWTTIIKSLNRRTVNRPVIGTTYFSAFQFKNLLFSADEPARNVK